MIKYIKIMVTVFTLLISCSVTNIFASDTNDVIEEKIDISENIIDEVGEEDFELLSNSITVNWTVKNGLIWGQGDGSYMPVVETKVGRAGAVICWENYMPLFRAYMYSQDLEIYCAPTVAVTDIWQASMRHIAHEGRCFVVSAVQYLPPPEVLGGDVPHWDPKEELMRGGSVIIDPQGNVLAGPLYHEEGLLTAEIDTDDIVRARYDLDVSGHYARPDVFKLVVDTRRKLNVEKVTEDCCCQDK